MSYLYVEWNSFDIFVIVDLWAANRLASSAT